MARIRTQGIIAAFGIVPLFVAIDYARSQSWAAVLIFGAVFVLVEAVAFWLVPLMTGRGIGDK